MELLLNGININALSLRADQITFNCPVLRIISAEVFKFIRVKFSAKLFIDSIK